MAKATARKIEKSQEAYRSIGEAANELGLQTHVLRYWESKFGKFVKPLKRRDGRRMFRAQDMEALRAIQSLVHERGMTLKGAEKLLCDQGVENVLSGRARLVPAEDLAEPALTVSPARNLQQNVRTAFSPAQPDVQATGSAQRLETVLADLANLKQRLDAARIASAA